MSKDRIVLACSGGLCTCVAIGWIAEETGAEIIAVAADVGQGGEDLEVIRQRSVYAHTGNPTKPREADEVVLTSIDGVPGAIDGKPVSVLGAIEQLDARAGAHGVGRLDMVEDRLVSIKSRQVYEVPGAQVLITAHQELEKLTVERDLARCKRGVEQRWSELAYDGLWFSPLEGALDEFVHSESHVSGEIRLTLHGGTATVSGRRSEASLYDVNLATYDEQDTFDQSLAQGFVGLWGMPSKIAARRDQRLGGTG